MTFLLRNTSLYLQLVDSRALYEHISTSTFQREFGEHAAEASIKTDFPRKSLALVVRPSLNSEVVAEAQR